MNAYYTATNESLDAIVAGLDLKLKDDVLAVCGSGDQAFAMLEYAREVVAVDVREEQVGFAKRRVESLKQGDFDHFLSPDEHFPFSARYEIKARNDYFQKAPDRLPKIRSKIPRLKILRVAIEDAFDLMKFNKIYLSNAIPNYLGVKSFVSAAKSVAKNGLIYVAHSYYVERIPDSGVCIDQQLTDKARLISHTNPPRGWNPGVFRKTG